MSKTRETDRREKKEENKQDKKRGLRREWDRETIKRGKGGWGERGRGMRSLLL